MKKKKKNKMGAGVYNFFSLLPIYVPNASAYKCDDGADTQFNKNVCKIIIPIDFDLELKSKRLYLVIPFTCTSVCV